jgi:hypothetical protein
LRLKDFLDHSKCNQILNDRLKLEMKQRKYFLERRLLYSRSLEVKREEDKTMRENFFHGLGNPTLDSLTDFSVLGNEMERHKSLPKLMNLYEKVNGFFDSKFESYWEEKTGLPWRGWDKL